MVRTTGHKPVVIRVDRHRTNRCFVATQYHRVSRRIFCAQIPQTRRRVPAASDDPAAIRGSPNSRVTRGHLTIRVLATSNRKPPLRSPTTPVIAPSSSTPTRSSPPPNIVESHTLFLNCDFGSYFP